MSFPLHTTTNLNALNTSFIIFLAIWAILALEEFGKDYAAPSRVYSCRI